MKAFMLAGVLLALPAEASDIDMLSLYDNAPKIERRHVVKVSASKPKAKPRKRKAHAFRPAPPTLSDGSKCFEPIAVTGSQWIGEEGAYESAVKAAKELIRWQIGEMAMDPANWKDVKRRCSMSSVGEIAGQVFHRCELVVTPCRPGFSNGVAK